MCGIQPPVRLMSLTRFIYYFYAWKALKDLVAFYAEEIWWICTQSSSVKPSSSCTLRRRGSSPFLPPPPPVSAWSVAARFIMSRVGRKRRKKKMWWWYLMIPQTGAKEVEVQQKGALQTGLSCLAKIWSWFWHSHRIKVLWITKTVSANSDQINTNLAQLP